MANKDEADKFAAELSQRFDDLMQWAIEQWPYPNFPLMKSDFAQSRREIGEILGPKLAAGNQGPAPKSGPDDSGQYIDVNPMPWP